MRLFATNTTDTTLVAMILALVYVVEKNADGTPIGAERNAAALTDLFGVLYSSTVAALDGLDGFAIHLMGLLGIGIGLILGGVMAEAASEEFVTAGGEQRGLASVVIASFVRRFHIYEK